MVYRVYVEKKAALANEARALLGDLRAFLGIESLSGLRLFNRFPLLRRIPGYLLGHGIRMEHVNSPVV